MDLDPKGPCTQYLDTWNFGTRSCSTGFGASILGPSGRAMRKDIQGLGVCGLGCRD